LVGVGGRSLSTGRETSSDLDLELPQLLGQRFGRYRLLPTAQHLAHDGLVCASNGAVLVEAPSGVGCAEQFQSRCEFLTQLFRDGELGPADEDGDRQTTNGSPSSPSETSGFDCDLRTDEFTGDETRLDRACP
jgi:hypothetical protein